MKKEELEFLLEAYKFLENPSFLTKATDTFGKPIEYAMGKLSLKSQLIVGKITEKALRKALQIAQMTIIENEKEYHFEKIKKSNKISRIGHNLATITTGAVGGFFGETGLLIELPLTTTLMMRSILSQGRIYNNLSKEELITNSLYIFSLGSSRSNKDDEMDSSYYTSRLMMDYSVRKAAEYMTANGPRVIINSSPIFKEFITKVAQRFNIAISEKMILESLPIIGAIGGASINFLFTNFFTNSARYHFGIKNLETIYGEEFIKNEYQKLKKN